MVISRSARRTRSGVTDLDTLAAQDWSIACGVSRDGLPIAGVRSTGGRRPDSEHTLMWTSAVTRDLGGLGLGGSAGALRTVLCRINDSGTIGIGWAQIDLATQSGVNVRVVWCAGAGFISAQSFIPGLGFNLASFSITETMALSGDGTTFVGLGSRSISARFRIEGFVVTVPGPGGVGVLIFGSCALAGRRRRV